MIGTLANTFAVACAALALLSPLSAGSESSIDNAQVRPTPLVTEQSNPETDSVTDSGLWGPRLPFSPR